MATKASHIESVRRRIIPVDQLDPYTRVLVFGPNKKGKTVFGGSGPSTIICDINERGTKSLIGRHDAHVFQAASWADVVYFYWFLKSGDHKYKTFTIDTATQMQHICMKQVLKEAEDRDPYKDPHTPSQREWLKVAELMKPQILNFRNLPMNCIFLAQERSVDNEEGENERVPDLSPGSRGTLMSAVDAIGRIYQKEVRVINKTTKRESTKWEARMLVGPHDTFPTGNRLGLPRVLRNPHMDMFIEAQRSLSNGEG